MNEDEIEELNPYWKELKSKEPMSLRKQIALGVMIGFPLGLLLSWVMSELGITKLIIEFIIRYLETPHGL